MDRQMQIVKATKEDASELLKLMHEVYDALEQKEWFFLDEDEALINYMFAEGFTLKAIVDGELAGIFVCRNHPLKDENLGIYLNLSEEEQSYVAHMEIAMVRDGYRGLGIQKHLMEQTEQDLKDQGYKYLMGTAHPENIYSVGNFKKLGYDIVTEAIKYGGMRRYVFCKHI